MNVTAYENDTMEKLEDFSILYLDYIFNQISSFLHFTFILHKSNFPFHGRIYNQKRSKDQL